MTTVVVRATGTEGGSVAQRRVGRHLAIHVHRTAASPTPVRPFQSPIWPPAWSLMGDGGENATRSPRRSRRGERRHHSQARHDHRRDRLIDDHAPVASGPACPAHRSTPPTAVTSARSRTRCLRPSPIAGVTPAADVSDPQPSRAAAAKQHEGGFATRSSGGWLPRERRRRRGIRGHARTRSLGVSGVNQAHLDKVRPAVQEVLV
jgi:hypothetical protein